MLSKFKQFKELHLAENLFVLPNAWDARSATLFQERGFAAIGTSSAAVAAGLQYADGEGMLFEEYLFVIKRILSSVKMPVTVDMEMGYGRNNEAIFLNILQLAQLGVAGINIEDSEIMNSKRALKDAKTFASTIEYIKNRLASQKEELFINVRCDTYLLQVENKQKETIKRLKSYEQAGADGIFLPCIADDHDITEAVENTKLPLNVMCIPGLPDFDVLNKLGVKRVSMGPFLSDKVYDVAKDLLMSISKEKNFSALFPAM